MSSINAKDAKSIILEENKLPESKGCFKLIDAIWPVRFKKRLPGDTGEIFIRTKLRNLFLYLIFLVTVSIIVYGMVGLINFHFSNGMISLFVDQPDANSKTFRNGFSSFDDVWNFMSQTLLNGLHPELWYDLSPTTDNNLGYIFYQNRILGLPRIYQIRVNNQNCEMSKSVQKVIGKCIPQYAGKYQSKSPFGKALQPGYSQNDTTYTAWQFKIDSQGGSYSGLVATYPADGFMINLGSRKADSQKIINDLKSNKWIDLYTRAVIIDFTVYNGNVNLFNQIRLVMEFPATGGVLNTFTVRTSKLLRYVSGFDFVVLGFECLFVLFVIYYTLEELIDIAINKCSYFKDFYNIMDLFILGLSYTTIGLSVYRTVQVNNLLDKLLISASSSFENFDNLTYYQEVFNQASAVVVFFSWIKIFKYISLNKTLEQLNSTLSKSGKDIAYFCVIFFIVFFAYAALGYLLFGETHQDYQSFFKTLFTLFRILLGDFDFVNLRKQFSFLGPLYFISFVFIGFFILLNMFMAIINQSYSKVKEEMAQSAPEFMLSDYLKLNYTRVVEKLNLRRNRILDIQEVLKSDEVSQKDELDFNLWRRELKKKGYADMEIEALFSRYDTDCDKKLNELEKIKLVRDIAKARSNLSQEFKNFKIDHKTTTKKDAFEVGDEVEEDEEDIEDRKMTRDDFDYIVARIDRMELSVASIINKIDRLFGHLENMELDKMRKRQEIGKLLNGQNNPEVEKNIYEIIENDA